jgi:hypothetical protein
MYKIPASPLRSHSLLLALFLMTICQTTLLGAQSMPARKTIPPMPVPMIPYEPQTYVCYYTGQSVTIDGDLSDSVWTQAPWTNLFVDIEGKLKPSPRFPTRVKMLWDSVYLYVGANLEEPDVWGTLTQRDAVIYHDNDFELFIDPDMDTHQYYELELNALNTVWDLLLIKPYRDGGPAVNAWDIQGLKSAVAVHGTLNRPGDVDSGWSVEIALPWTVLAECAHRPSPPRDGDQWKINFSRVEWQTRVVDSTYRKLADSLTGSPLPENNWVWSPQGLIAMHYPEMWGVVQFSNTQIGTRAVPFKTDPIDAARWALRKVFFAERNYHNLTGTYTDDVSKLALGSDSPVGFDWPPTIQATADLFRAEMKSREAKMRVYILQDGQVIQEDN